MPSYVQVLTGATGSLGSFILEQLSHLGIEVIARIICLVRAEDDGTARARVESALKSRGLVLGEEEKLLVYAADTSAEKLGLSEAAYQKIVEGVDVILHVSHGDFGKKSPVASLMIQAAWPVHFASSLVSFEDSIKGE